MKLPFFAELEKSRRVLIAGAGGGFDIYAGLPLFFHLRAMGKEVHLANLSFTNFYGVATPGPLDSLNIVDAETSGSTRYFPELHLARWLESEGVGTSIYCIHRDGATQVRAAYEWITATIRPDTVVLVDGGTDILMRGDEIGLGTPQEDIASLAAVDSLTGIERKLIACLGFGVDTHHGVCHALFLENVAALIADGGFLGSWSLMREMHEFQLYEAACDYAQARHADRESIVNTSIIASGNGWFGDRHPTKRTEGSNLFLNPLMTQYWTFDLGKVAQRNLYLDQIRDADSYSALSLRIETFRAKLQRERPWVEIPF